MTKWMRVQNGLWEARINNVLWICTRMDNGRWRLSMTSYGIHIAPRGTLAECKALAEAMEIAMGWRGMKPHIDCVSCGHRFTDASVYSQDDLEYIARRDYGYTWFELGWLCRTCTEESTP